MIMSDELKETGNDMFPSPIPRDEDRDEQKKPEEPKNDFEKPHLPFTGKPRPVTPTVDKKPERNEPAEDQSKVKSGDKKEIVVVKVKRINKSNVPIPALHSEKSSCYDVYVDLTGTPHGDSINIPANGTRVVPTNLKFEVPEGYELQVRPKEGYTTAGVLVLYTPIGIDASYKEELKITVLNLSGSSAKLIHGQKIAQISITKVLNSKIIQA
jgi:dUTP pyrophosphatase